MSSGRLGWWWGLEMENHTWALDFKLPKNGRVASDFPFVQCFSLSPRLFEFLGTMKSAASSFFPRSCAPMEQPEMIKSLCLFYKHPPDLTP